MKEAAFDFDLLRIEFATNGFAVVRGFCERSEIDDLNGVIDAFISRVPTIPDTGAFYVDEDRPESITQLQLLDKYDDTLR